MPELPNHAAAVPTTATIHDAQNADQKLALIPGTIQSRSVNEQCLTDQTSKNDRDPADAGGH